MEILTTPRLRLRQLEEGDFDNLCTILQDPMAMYAYEHAFSQEEVEQWLARQLWRYREEGFGLWAVEDRETGTFLGQCGLTMQEGPSGRVPEVGYLFRRKVWGQGYAAEGARACLDHGFDRLGLEEIYAFIRDNNLPSQRVARRCGMTPKGVLVKHYWGMDMPHIIFSLRAAERMPDRRAPGG